MMMHEHARIDTSKIAAFVKKYDGKLTFTAVGKNPTFVYNMARNSRDAKKTDVLALLTGLAGEMTALL